jgi:hypothetical protein
MRSFDGSRVSPQETLAGISTVLCLRGTYFILQFYAAVEKVTLEGQLEGQ